MNSSSPMETDLRKSRPREYSRVGRKPILALALALASLWLPLTPAHGQLFDNLRALGGLRLSVGDPQITLTNRLGDILDGPKDIAAADLDGDGNADLVASDKDGSV